MDMIYACNFTYEVASMIFKPRYIYDYVSKWKCNGPLWEKSTRWIPLTKASYAKLWCFFLNAPEQTVDKTTETPVI